jgi:hypothetical protein
VRLADLRCNFALQRASLVFALCRRTSEAAVLIDELSRRYGRVAEAPGTSIVVKSDTWAQPASHRPGERGLYALHADAVAGSRPLLCRVGAGHAAHPRRPRASAQRQRGGGVPHMSLEGVVAVATGEDAATDLVALDEALIGLTRIDPRKAQIVEMRFFGGLTVEEIGGVLKVSPGTVKRDWRAAKAWLYQELTR